MHCMLMDLLHGFEVLSTTEETLFNSRNVSRLVQMPIIMCFSTQYSVLEFGSQKAPPIIVAQAPPSSKATVVHTLIGVLQFVNF